MAQVLFRGDTVADELLQLHELRAPLLLARENGRAIQAARNSQRHWVQYWISTFPAISDLR